MKRTKETVRKGTGVMSQERNKKVTTLHVSPCEPSLTFLTFFPAKTWRDSSTKFLGALRHALRRAQPEPGICGGDKIIIC